MTHGTKEAAKALSIRDKLCSHWNGTEQHLEVSRTNEKGRAMEKQPMKNKSIYSLETKKRILNFFNHSSDRVKALKRGDSNIIISSEKSRDGGSGRTELLKT